MYADNNGLEGKIFTDRGDIVSTNSPTNVNISAIDKKGAILRQAIDAIAFGDMTVVGVDTLKGRLGRNRVFYPSPGVTPHLW